MISTWLLLVVPAAVAAYLLHLPALPVFALGVVAVGVLADWVRRATEQVANRAGPAVGGLLNISFGSVAELVLALFVLIDGKPGVVQAQVTGSIMGTALLGLGLAALVGGLRRPFQSFQRETAGQLSTMLILVVIALLLPAVFDLAGSRVQSRASLAVTDEQLSLWVSVVLLVLYGGNLVYTLVTHRDVFARDEEGEHGGGASWGLGRSFAVMIGGTVAIALCSEIVADALADAAQILHMSEIFLGVVVLALVGTSADLFAAVVFARADRMGLVMAICIGSAIQVALVVAPLLVLASWALGHPMTLVFANPLDLFAIAGTAFIVNSVAADGRTTWFEGLLLVGVYVALALAFFFASPA